MKNKIRYLYSVLKESKGSFLIFVLILSFFILFLFYPLVYIFYNTFFVNGKFTFDYVRLMLSDPLYVEAMKNSLTIATISTIITLCVGVPLAVLFARYDFPNRAVFQGLLLAPMVMPPFVGAIGLQKIFARYGAINIFLKDWLHLIERPIDWLGGGFWGIIILEVIHLYPIVYLNAIAALANIDPTLEETAEILGAKGIRLFLTITFPLMLPGVIAGGTIVFIWAFTDLGTPLIFNYKKVIPVLIFDMTRQIYTNPMGYALSFLVLVIATVAFLLIREYVSLRRYEMLGRGHIASRVYKISGLKGLLINVFLILFLILALMPHISVILTSIAEEWFMSVLPERYTGRFYFEVFRHSLTITGIKNSLLYSSLSTLLDIALGVAIAYICLRSKIPGRGLLDILAMWPLALPGIIIAFGYLTTFSDTMFDPRTNPVPLLVLCYAVRRLPYSVRAIYAGLQQVHIALEEAAQVLGAKPLKVIKDITVPLIMANILAGGILSFSQAMLEVSSSLVLAMHEKEYPISKVIYELYGRLRDGPYIASAMGVLGMLLIIAALLIANRVLGRRMGELFRA